MTGQQSRVLEFVAEGFLNKQIAQNLKICETTVKAHMGEILRKLKVANRTQAALWAIHQGFDRPQARSA